jgi:quinol monooxygenase YgiN
VIWRLAVLHSLTLSAFWLSSSAVASDPAKVLTFIEVRSDAVDRSKTLLKQYEAALRRNAGPPHVEIVEEIDRPERFVVIETAGNADALAAAEAGAQQVLGSLNDWLTAPMDRRTHRDFGDVPASTTNESATTGLYVISHLDLGPPDQARGQTALTQVIDAARHSPGNLRFAAWQQANRPNHFNIVAVWSSRTKLNDFAASAAARAFRTSVGPLIGSLYDERLYRRID